MEPSKTWSRYQEGVPKLDGYTSVLGWNGTRELGVLHASDLEEWERLSVSV